MKKARKNLFSAAIAALAVFMAFQVALIKSGPQTASGITESGAFAAKAASQTEDSAAVEVNAPTTGKIKVLPVPAAIIIDSTEKSAIQNNGIGLGSAKKQQSNASMAKETAAVASSGPKQIFPGIIYDEDNGLLYGPNGKGLLNIGFDYDLNQKLFYSAINGWQRNFGYTKTYDVLAPLTNILFQTRMIYFTYGGLDWMIQLWKGQYGITSGAEVGVYNKPSGSGNLVYDCASKDNYLMMNLNVFKNGQPYFTRPAQMHWWLTGFVLGDIVSPDDLNIKTTITFKDNDMTDAFINALSTQSNTKDVYYVVSGNNVSLDW
jgi:hypothetical protein